MNSRSSFRTAWLEPVLRTMLGIALVAAVVWALTEGGSPIPVLSADGE